MSGHILDESLPAQSRLIKLKTSHMFQAHLTQQLQEPMKNKVLQAVHSFYIDTLTTRVAIRLKAEASVILTHHMIRMAGSYSIMFKQDENRRGRSSESAGKTTNFADWSNGKKKWKKTIKHH